MVLLERSKVRLKCVLDNTLYRPGEMLSGRVQLEVKEPITFSSLRLRMRGTEKVEVYVQRGAATLAFFDELDYVDCWMTFTGPARSSHSKETQLYDAGSYSYPFSLPLGTDLPPSFAAITSAGRVSLQYTVEVVLDIPNGFNATKEAAFTMLSVVPAGQLRVHDQQQQSGAVLAFSRTAKTFKHKWGACLWGKQTNASVRVAAAVLPRVVTLQRNGAALTPPRCTVELRLLNEGREVLQDVRVELYNVVRLHYDLHESFSETLVATGTVAGINLLPGEQERALSVPLALPFDSFRRQTSVSTKLPVPSLLTPVVTSTYMLRVRFPKKKVAKNITFVGLIDIVDCESSVRGLPFVPPQFMPASLHGYTEVRYVTQPSAVHFPEPDEVQYATAHVPYMSREDPAATNAHDDGVAVLDEQGVAEAIAAAKEREKTERGKKPGKPTGPPPVDATPMPGHIVHGSVAGVHAPPARRSGAR